MRKLIDIPESTMKRLQHICIDEDTNPKNFIEDLVEKEVDRLDPEGKEEQE